MFGFRTKPQSWLVTSVADTHLRYLYLDTDDQGLFVRNHGVVGLPLGVIVKGEVLRAQAFLDILKSLHKELFITESFVENIILIPQEQVVVADLIIPTLDTGKKLSPQVYQFLKEHQEEYPWITNHSYAPVYDKRSGKVYLEAIRVDRYTSLETIFVQAGFTKPSLHGELSFAGFLLRDQKQYLSLIVGEDITYLAEYEYGYLRTFKRFEFSYRSLERVVAKYLHLSSPIQARTIVTEYGIARSHREETVYRELTRTLTPLTDVLRKRCTVSHIPVSILYLGVPLLGMVDALELRLPGQVNEFDPFSDLLSGFHNVLALHADQRHTYNLLALAVVAQRA